MRKRNTKRGETITLPGLQTRFLDVGTETVGIWGLYYTGCKSKPPQPHLRPETHRNGKMGRNDLTTRPPKSLSGFGHPNLGILGRVYAGRNLNPPQPRLRPKTQHETKSWGETISTPGLQTRFLDVGAKIKGCWIFWRRL